MTFHKVQHIYNKQQDMNDAPLEDLIDFLYQCHQLKKKATKVQNSKRSLPAWLEKMLGENNNPSNNNSRGKS